MRNVLREKDNQKANKEDYIAPLDFNITSEEFIVT